MNNNREDRVLILIDGEHTIPVISKGLEKLRKMGKKIVAGLFVGGFEKIGDLKTLENELGIPVEILKTDFPNTLQLLNEKHGSFNTIFDLSDHPILSPKDRMRIGVESLIRGYRYEGADFSFDPLELKENVLDKFSLGVIGTGKRTGKTAISAYIAKLLKEKGIEACIVTMGRGGPEKPELIKGKEIKITPQFLVDLVKKGYHAASDCWENALTAKVTIVGCSRCSGGLAGKTFYDNVLEGAKIANSLPLDVVILEGSGTTVPSIKADKYVVTVSAWQSKFLFSGYLSPIRIKISSLVIITGCELPLASSKRVGKIVRKIKAIKPEIDVVKTVFRPMPLGDITGKKVFYASTTPRKIIKKNVDYLEKTFNCSVSYYTNQLSNRFKLRNEVEKNLEKADVLLTELKASAVDTATVMALSSGKEVIYAHNVPIYVGGTVESLEEAILSLIPKNMGVKDS
ncbi:MAG: 2,3-diphosphoglycerate synthetase [Asgard group archaeon]